MLGYRDCENPEWVPQTLVRKLTLYSRYLGFQALGLEGVGCWPDQEALGACERQKPGCTIEFRAQVVCKITNRDSVHVWPCWKGYKLASWKHYFLVVPLPCLRAMQQKTCHSNGRLACGKISATRTDSPATPCTAPRSTVLCAYGKKSFGLAKLSRPMPQASTRPGQDTISVRPSDWGRSCRTSARGHTPRMH